MKHRKLGVAKMTLRMLGFMDARTFQILIRDLARDMQLPHPVNRIRHETRTRTRSIVAQGARFGVMMARLPASRLPRPIHCRTPASPTRRRNAQPPAGLFSLSGSVRLSASHSPPRRSRHVFAHYPPQVPRGRGRIIAGRAHVCSHAEARRKAEHRRHRRKRSRRIEPGRRRPREHRRSLRCG